MKQLLLASTSSLFGESYLAYLEKEIQSFFKYIDEIVFIPYARPSGISYDDYTQKLTDFFSKLDIKVSGLHTFSNPVEAVMNAKAFFTGGGNTFLLLKTLQDLHVLPALKKVVDSGVFYMGTSAGTNIAGLTIGTTNDMPIVHPASLNAMQLVPFNINPHYLDPHPEIKHNGETRETRILEFLTQNNIPVVGLREGSWLRVSGDTVLLQGVHTARIFEKGRLPYELAAGEMISFS